MQSQAFLLSCALLAVCPVAAQEQLAPTVDGYVTRADSNTDFDVNGVHILCDEKTRVQEIDDYKTISTQGCSQIPVFVGEVVQLYKSEWKKKQAIEASWIGFAMPQFGDDTSGSAVIDAVPSENSSDPQRKILLLRADGYPIQISQKTEIAWVAPRQSLADVKAGDWIDYRSKVSESRVLVASWVRIGPDIVRKREEKQRANTEFDPSSVPQSARQSRLSLGIEGMNPKKLAPYQDPAMQARLDEIGNKLVPAYQREMPASDPEKIHFRFQLVDSKFFRYALPLASGVILVPHQVVERMQNDAQLAAILADAIASVIEKEAYNWSPTKAKLRAAAYATEIAGSGALIASLAGATLAASVGWPDLWAPQEQNLRVSLGLLQDAGYDINQAPMAWWLLAPKKPKPLWETSMPGDVSYLYGILGEVWNNPRSVAVRSPANP